MTTYVDSSVVLRIVFGEPQPFVDWPGIDPVASELVRVECLRVVDRARIHRALDDEQTARHRTDVIRTIDAFDLVRLTPLILERAADPMPTLLGTLDAIHLATARELRLEYPDLKFATHDRELALAARAVGFAVTGA